MSYLVRKQGDLLEMVVRGEFDVISHGCNCFHKMRSGIAGQITRRWPAVAAADLETEYGSREKLGSYSSYVTPEGFHIHNVYTQFDYGYDGRDRFEYDAFDSYLRTREQEIYKMAELFKGFSLPATRLGFPLIGCGLAGGDPSRILSSLEDFASVVAGKAIVTLVEFR